MPSIQILHSLNSLSTEWPILLSGCEVCQPAASSGQPLVSQDDGDWSGLWAKSAEVDETRGGESDDKYLGGEVSLKD